MSQEVLIVEVGPRDGLQNEPTPAPLETKIELIDRLGAAGLKAIEAGAFVSPKWVPQMADSAELFRRLDAENRFREGVAYTALAPNMTGYEAAVAAGLDEIAVFAAASETFSRKNLNCSIAESLARFEPMIEAARGRFMRVRGYVSCAVACPYEGPIAPEQAAAVVEGLLNLGCAEISLGDTIGAGTPRAVKRLLAAVAERAPLSLVAGHFHDTYGMAMANTAAALDAGVRVFDASVAGLGGCPYAPGAAGNLATEDLVYFLEGEGVATGVDLAALAATGAWISERLGRPTASKAGRALAARASA